MLKKKKKKKRRLVQGAKSTGLKNKGRTSLAVQRLRLHASTAGSMASIPGRGTEIPRAMRGGQKKKTEADYHWNSNEFSCNLQEDAGTAVPVIAMLYPTCSKHSQDQSGPPSFCYTRRNGGTGRPGEGGDVHEIQTLNMNDICLWPHESDTLILSGHIWLDMWMG